jgi:LmbE family N-acetylglucosaminyl deacetylase
VTSSSTVRAAAKGAVRLLSSSGLRAAGRDVTDAFAGRRTLVVAPHPDDETLGCGAAIARMRALGTPVTVVLMSGGGATPRPADLSLQDMLQLRREEATRALSILGVEEDRVVHLDFEDGAMPQRHQEMTQALSGLVAEHAPQQVLVTSARDRHPDHAAVAHAVRAAATAGDVGVYEYAVWQRVPALTVARAGRRPLLVSSSGFVDRKEAAIAAYESQLPHFPAGFVEDFLLPFETFTQVVAPGSGSRQGSVSGPP